MNIHQICEQARNVKCVCLAPPGCPCVCQPHAYHLARFSAARAAGLISPEDFSSVIHDGLVANDTNVVLDEVPA